MRTAEEIHQDIIEMRKELEELAEKNKKIVSLISGALTKMQEIVRLLDEDCDNKEIGH